MSRFLVTALGAAVLLSAFSPLALAGEPDPNNSTCDLIVGASPANLAVGATFKYIFDCTLNDNTGQAVPAFPRLRMELDFTSCAAPDTRPGGDDTIPADADSDLNGNIQWYAALVWGGDDPCVVRVLKDGVAFKTLDADGGGQNPDGGVRNPDNNGDGNITAQDLANFQDRFFPPPTNDFIGDLGPVYDGNVTAQDLATFQNHFFAL